MTNKPKKRSFPKLKKLPSWAKEALQGVAYWMGHRRCLFRHYPLAEGALVAEICNLIHANLHGSLMLRCEVLYAELLPEAPEPKHVGKGEKILTEKSRADLVVSEVSPHSGTKPRPKFIIEVKRASAPKAYIDADLRRLAEVRHGYPGARAFLFLISEANRPDRFVNEKGSSRTGRHPIPNSKDHFRVRRTWKAAHAFKNRDRAQYACLLEVYIRKTT